MTESNHRKLPVQAWVRQAGETIERITSLIENNPKKGIDNPTKEFLLKQFDEINLTIVHLPDQIIRHVTPLTDLQAPFWNCSDYRLTFTLVWRIIDESPFHFSE